MAEKVEWQIVPCLSNGKRTWKLESRREQNTCWTTVLYCTSIKQAKAAYAHLHRKPIKLR